MKKTILFSILTSCIVLSAFAQRYQTPIFKNLQIDSLTYSTHHNMELKLDLIQPLNDSTLSPRPLIIFMHGGSFMEGIRNKEDVLNFCKEWAYKGYVVATISYRLTLKGKSFHCDFPNESKIETFKNAAYDLHLATDFLISRKELFNIDDKTVILAGNSAGAEAVLHGAFFKDNQLIKKVLPNHFRYAGIISYAGAIIDTSLITAQNHMPIALLHGTCDQWVPYASNYHHFCEQNTPGALMLHGSKSIMDRMKHLNGTYYLHTLCGQDHSVNKTALIYQLQNTVDFVYETIIQKKKIQRHFIEKTNNTPCKFGEYHYCK